MRPNLPIVLFSDVDGVLRDLPTRSIAAAASALEYLSREHIPLVLCSSKTRAELEHIQQELGIRHPFVCENGGATFIPRGYFGFEVPSAHDLAGYEAVEFGRAYPEVVETLHRTADRLRIDIGFSDMSVEEVARECHLTLLHARLAKLREYEELFRLLDPSPTVRNRIFKALHAARLRCINSGEYEQVGGPVDKHLGMNWLCTLYRRERGPILTVGLADAMADANLLQLVDHSIIGHDDDTAKGAVDVVSWAEAIVDIVQELRQKSVLSPLGTEFAIGDATGGFNGMPRLRG